MTVGDADQAESDPDQQPRHQQAEVQQSQLQEDVRAADCLVHVTVSVQQRSD